MLCEECGKNEATIHFQTIGPEGEQMSKDICEECFEKLKARMPGVNAIDISGFLGALLGKLAGARQERENDKFDAVCPTCGTKYAEFKRSQNLGCANCYGAFRERIEEILVKRNHSALYTGSAPHSAKGANEEIYKYKKLKEEMKQAIAGEDFERAAKIRDELRRLESCAAGKEA